MKKLFVWDFHGTLERGNDLAVWEISNVILKELGFKQRFTQKQCLYLSGRKWFEYFKYLLPEEGEARWLELQEACFRYSDSHPEIIAKHIRPTPYAHIVLKAIGKKYCQILISNTRPSSLKIFIKVTGVEKYFLPDRFFAVDGHGIRNRLRNKRKILKEYVKHRDFNRLVVIGDSPKDINIASVIPGSVRYLFMRKGRNFRICKADFRIRDLRQVLQEL